MKRLLWIFLLTLLVSFKHPFYLSVTDLKYNSSENALQGSVKIFTNDLESALKRLYKRPVDLIHPKDSAATRGILRNYLDRHLLLKVNGQGQAIHMLGYEREEEAIWIYIELKACPLPKKIEIENSILYEDISSQSNIIHLEVDNVKKSIKLDFPEKKAEFLF